MSLVLGKDVVFAILQNGNYIPVACSRTCSFTTTTEIAGKSTVGSGLNREFTAIVNGATITADGVVSFDNNTPVSSLRVYQLNHVVLQFYFTIVDEGGEGVIYAGSFIITNITETGSYNDMATYSLQGTVTGEVTITSTVGNSGIIYFGVQEDTDDPIDFTRFIVGDPDQDITINYSHVAAPLVYWMAHSIAALQKTNWEDQNDIGNAGGIGLTTDLYEVRMIDINGSSYLLYITRYITIFNGYEAIVKYIRVPGACEPPTDFVITDITPGTTDTGSITVESTGGSAQLLTIFGAPQPSGIFTVSIYGVLVSVLVVAGMADSDIAAAITTAINDASIPVPGGNQPPSVVAASHTPGFDLLTVVSGTPPAASASYLPASLANVTFGFTEPDVPGNAYTIRIINTDLGTTINNTGGTAPKIISVRRGYNYKFAIRTDCDNGSSDWTADLIQFIG